MSIGVSFSLDKLIGDNLQFLSNKEETALQAAPAQQQATLAAPQLDARPNASPAASNIATQQAASSADNVKKYALFGGLALAAVLAIVLIVKK